MNITEFKSAQQVFDYLEKTPFIKLDILNKENYYHLISIDGLIVKYQKRSIHSFNIKDINNSVFSIQFYFTDDDYMRLNKLNTIYSYYSESLYECERDYELILNILSANIRKEKLKRLIS